MDNKLYFKSTEHKSYKEKIKNNLLLNLFISVIIMLLISNISNIIYGLVISLFLFIVQMYKSNNRDKYFIIELDISTDNVKLIYNNKDDLIEINDSKSFFDFKKKIAFNKTRTAYLEISYKEEKLLNQYEEGIWNEKEFDLIISILQKE